MKHLLTTLALIASTSIAYADGPVFIMPEEPPLTTPERVTDWTGFNIGLRAGYGQGSYTESIIGSREVTETLEGIRDITEHQCWKSWNGNPFKSRLKDVYCTAPDTPGLSQHLVDNAVWYEDIVIGTETYSYDVTTVEEYTYDVDGTEDFMSYGVHVGYDHDFGSIIVGGQAFYNVYATDNFPIDSVMGLKLRAGVDLGSVFAYGFGGYGWADNGDSGALYGAGAEIMVSRNWSVFGEVTQIDLQNNPHSLIEFGVARSF